MLANSCFQFCMLDSFKSSFKQLKIQSFYANQYEAYFKQLNIYYYIGYLK